MQVYAPDFVCDSGAHTISTVMDSIFASSIPVIADIASAPAPVFCAWFLMMDSTPFSSAPVFHPFQPQLFALFQPQLITGNFPAFDIAVGLDAALIRDVFLCIHGADFGYGEYFLEDTPLQGCGHAGESTQVPEQVQPLVHIGLQLFLRLDKITHFQKK